MSTKRVFGIDLGTTYSCVSRVDDHGKPEVIANAEGQLTTPSVVYFESEDNVVVGHAAKEEAQFRPELVLSAVKLHMGREGAEFPFHGRTYKPEEISAYILMKLARDAEQITGEKVEDVVITCPAYFGDAQKKATEQAGTIAGLNVLYVIPEPTAAAIAYGMDQEEDQVILVYDLGGGTFDMTLIEVKSGAITVRSVGGDDRLGGKDWDGHIVQYFASMFSQATGVSGDELMDDPETMWSLIGDAEDAKVALSQKEKVTKAIRFGTDRANVDLTREEFDKQTASELERTIGFTESMIARARELGHERIDKVLLVGGSSFMPQVKDALEKFGIEIQILDPNLIVAKGAAIFGHKCQMEEMVKIAIAEKTGQDAADVELEETDEALKEEAIGEMAHSQGLTLPGVKNLLDKDITNVTSKSFGIVVQNEETGALEVTNLIQKDEALPIDISRTFGTSSENQTSVDLRCMENLIITTPEQTLDPDGCTEIGNAVLAFERPLPKGSPVEVTFRLGPDGRLFMGGRDLTTSQEIEATFETDSIMSREEVEAAASRALQMKVSG